MDFVERLAAWDVTALKALNSLAWPWLDALFVWGSARSVGATLGVLAGVLVVRRFRQRSWPMIAAMAAAVGLTDAVGARLLKPLIGRVRPCYALNAGEIRMLVPAANVGSMPSLHSANAFAAATLLCWVWPRAGLYALPVALFVGVSRVGVGVHWPSDVLGGAALGATIGSIFGFAARIGLRRWSAVAAVSRPE
jgi:undecaprenyl-diphosphatase